MCANDSGQSLIIIKNKWNIYFGSHNRFLCLCMAMDLFPNESGPHDTLCAAVVCLPVQTCENDGFAYATQTLK